MTIISQMLEILHGSNGLKLGGTLVTATASDINNAATTGKAIAMAMVFG